MIEIRFAEDRGKADHGWLDSRHTFSFGQYHDPDHMGFGPLRVINEDRVTPKGGFAEHGHKDMEIISYVLDGTLEHKDSMGNGTQIVPGDVQRMTAGAGVRHSEYNPSDSFPVHFLQIWIEPEQDGLEPGYEQRSFAHNPGKDPLKLVASRDGRDGSLTIHQDADVYLATLDAHSTVTHKVRANRRTWVQIARGEVAVAGHALCVGDGLAATDEASIELVAKTQSEVLLFDLP